MKEDITWCDCMAPRSLTDAFKDIFSVELVDGSRRGELWELFEVRSFEELADEWSDIMYGIGRLAAGIVGREYVRVPGDGRHFNKIATRMANYGCIRSKRFLVDGRCPSE